jgi:hypothetical protein
MCHMYLSSKPLSYWKYRLSKNRFYITYIRFEIILYFNALSSRTNSKCEARESHKVIIVK